jgi:hypothetical protein
VQPGRQPGGFADLPGVLEQDEERGLKGIVGIDIRARQMPAHGPHESAMPANQLRECGLAALRDKLAEQVAIADCCPSVGERAENVLEESRTHVRPRMIVIHLGSAHGGLSSTGNRVRFRSFGAGRGGIRSVSSVHESHAERAENSERFLPPPNTMFMEYRPLRLGKIGLEGGVP